MEYTSYFVRRRARFKDINGRDVNIPYGSVFTAENDLILNPDGTALTHTVCDNAKNFFVQNDDKKGKERADLVNKITKFLERRYPIDTIEYKKHQNLWNKVWEDELCNKYRRKDNEDHWLWSQDFYNASIDDLVYIAKLLNLYVKGDI